MSEHELWNELGNLYFMTGAYPQAIQAYQRSIQLDATYGKPFSNLALTYAHLEKYEDAVILFRRSLDLLTEGHDKAISWNRLGKVYRHLKNYEQAVIAFQHADELEPECTEDSEEPAQMLYASSDRSGAFQEVPASLPEAQEVSASALHQPPVEPAAEILEGASTFSDPPKPEQAVSGNPETTSLTDWSDVDLDYMDSDWSSEFPDENEIYLSITETGDMDNDFAIPVEAPLDPVQGRDVDESPLELFEPVPAELVNWQPAGTQAFSRSSAEAVDLRGAEHQAGRYAQDAAVDVADELPAASFVPLEKSRDAAIQAEEMPVSIQSMDKTSGVNSQEITDLEVQIAKYKRVVQINERNAAAWDALGTLYKSAGLYKEAVLAHQQAISIEPTRASYYHHLGLDFAGAKRDEDAISAFQKVIELDPDHYLAHATLGGYYRKLGLEELAQKHIGKAMRNIYDNESEYNRACLAAISGNVDQAIALLQVALEKRQTYLEWVIHDPDLDFIREDTRFKTLISTYNG